MEVTRESWNAFFKESLRESWHVWISVGELEHFKEPTAAEPPPQVTTDEKRGRLFKRG
ncbi:hypothetical protein [Streptomyces sp. 2A115]|uniref:hypothetical protein n=1 Tax=Streptomyces sp. 2A115 TaxID=3457439 RepID=UPI003FD1B9E1